jgi:hypothetical protein
VTRRIVSIIAATAMLFAMLPAMAAFASASSTANLSEASRTIFPGADRPFSISLTNNESGGLLGLGGGSSINWVRVILPTSRGFTLGGAAGSIAKSGWTVTERRDAGSQTLTFSGGSLSPGSSTTFDFPVNVARPASADREGPIQVMVSSNGGETAREASGNLVSLVKILEVVDGLVTAPAGAADGTGSAGQVVDYAVRVRNHAANGVSVAPSFSSRNGDTVAQSPGASTITGNGAESTFLYKIQLNPSTTTDRTHTFDLGAAKSDGTSAATQIVRTYGVQVPPRLRMIESNGAFSPRYVQPGSLDYRFRGTFQKLNTPALTVTGGSLEFADTTVALDPSHADSQATWTNGGQQVIASERTSVTGDDGDYNVTYTFDIVDGNDFAFEQQITSANRLLTIDGILPIIRNLATVLPEDDDGARQTYAKNGDPIQVTGEVVDRNPDRDSLAVTLVIPGQEDVAVPAENISTTTTPDGFSFTAQVNPDFGVDEGDFWAEVHVLDLADNSGDATGEEHGIDNIAPNLATTGYLIDERNIEVHIHENQLLLGGCNASTWSVEGELFIQGVYFSDGSPCQAGQADPSGANIRILRLNNAKDRAWQGNVTYSPQSPVLGRNHSDRLKDGAGHYAARADQAIRSLVAPIMPTLQEVLRQGGAETAVFDEDRYWVRTGGNGDVSLSIRGDGVRRGDVLEVLNESGQVIASSTEATENNESLSAAVPIGTSETTYTRRIRLFSPMGIPGEARAIQIQLDRTVPRLVSAQRVDEDHVEVTFDDVIWRGSNFAGDWRAYEDDEGQLAEIGVRSVSGSRTTRTIEVARQGFGSVAGTEYDFFQEANNLIYEDRAGNQHAPRTFVPVGGAF